MLFMNALPDRQTDQQTNGQSLLQRCEDASNKAGYTATPVAHGWTGAIFEVSRAFGQEQQGQKPQKPKK